MSHPGGTLIYAGIDEAGYGPRVGPLCVGLAALRIGGWREGDAPPDVWKLLKPVVCRDAPGAANRRAGRVPVNDSKQLKLANSGKRHPLTHLEAGVLCFLASWRAEPAPDDASLLAALGCAFGDACWQCGPPLPTPRSTTPETLGVLTNALRARLEQRSVGVALMACRAVCERDFNAGLARTGSKAAVSFAAAAELLRLVWDAHGAEHPRVVIDRQGGRTRYAEALEAALPGARVESAIETDRVSRYEVSDGARRMAVQFQVEADSAHFPTALASMTAKLIRELAMERFNSYWTALAPELKPTAGYGIDGRRWIDDAERLLGRDAVAPVVRLA